MIDLIAARLGVADTPGAAGLLAVIVAISLFGLFVAPAFVERNLFRPYWLVRRSEYPTLLTSAFLHADVPHLLFNGITLWAFGFALERAIGTASFLALDVIGILAGDLGTWARHRDDPAHRSLGASGAILAVLFASIVQAPSNAIFILPIPVPIPAPLFAVAYLAMTVYASRRGGGRISHDAHLGGALAGVAFMLATEPETARRAWSAVLG